MKYFLGFVLCVCFSASAQNSSFGIAAFGHVTFLGEMNPTASYGGGASLLWQIGPWRAMSVSFGASSGQYTQFLRANKIENGVVIYDNMWSYVTTQRVAPLDLSYLEDVLVSHRHHLYIGGGASILFHSFSYPDTVAILDQGILAPYEQVQSKTAEFAVNGVVCYMWDVSAHWFFENRTILRLPIPQRVLLVQPSNWGFPGVNSSFIPSVTLGLGYRF